MLSSAHMRSLIAARWRDWLPLLALPLAALAILLALGGDRARFQRDGGFHHQLSAKNLAIAENLSPKHNFLLATRVWRAEDGGFAYTFYGRFPIGGYVLIKLAGLPFESDLAASLLAARVLALAMFCGAALFSYLAVARVAGSRRVAFAAAACAFSGFYALHYADAVAGETSMDLFGVMLVFHGMVVFAQDGRFRQLLIKTCLALLLGWHVYALILPFALWGLGGEAFAFVRANAGSSGGGGRILSALPALARSRFIALAAVSILFGSALLGFNLANEYAVLEGEVPLAELHSARSALSRTSLSGDGGFLEGYARTLADSEFWALQLMRAGVASVPYALAPSLGDGQRESPEVSRFAAGAGVLALGAALGGLALVRRRRRVLLAALALFGFFWAIPMKGNTAFDSHYHEGIYYIGLPMAIVALALMGARAKLGERRGERLAAAAAAAFAVAFALSVFHESRLYEERGALTAELDMAALSELRGMRDAVRGGDVLATSDIAALVGGFSRYGVDYALGGTTFVSENLAIPYDFVISRYRDESFDPLTPDNRFMFLYGAETDPDDLRRAARARLEASEPAARSEFDVYLQDGALLYLRTHCSLEDTRAFFFAHFFPPDAAYLRGEVDRAEFSGMNFRFSDAGKIFDGVCMAAAELPDHPIAAIRTGQYISDRRGEAALAGEDSVWQALIALPPSAETVAMYESAYAAIRDGGDPAERSGFDIYLDADGGAISYLKRPCTEEDARGRFWLSVHPANAADLPAERQALGHESLNFDFVPPHGVVFNGKCVATIRLPDYEIAKMETGQDAPDAGELWEADIFPPPSAERIMAYESAYQAIADGGDPAAQSGFDIYLDADGGAISYLKQPCTEEDARGRFWLSVHPANVGDLPAERQALGHESLNFDFVPPHAAAFNGKCMATIQLPGYEIAKMETGQDADGERLWEAAIDPRSAAARIAAYENAYQTVADGEPAARSGFDVYLDADGGAIIYLKRPCSEEDARGRFFLSIYPANAADLPAERRELGHESLNFDFVPPHGAAFNGKCMATRQLPDYEIAKVETGQWMPGGGRLWEAEIAAVGD